MVAWIKKRVIRINNIDRTLCVYLIYYNHQTAQNKHSLSVNAKDTLSLTDGQQQLWNEMLDRVHNLQLFFIQIVFNFEKGRLYYGRCSWI